ncbi:unnamed protein product [Clonostachys solani]|uniref:Methionine--tRNA ligase, mitochondrial n=1 Tax=Clonostachys solani TaxID=160281 RepID=A0A9N9VYH7_9HYPO|nr:unnamed protein product [Clonostachys solani]
MVSSVLRSLRGLRPANSPASYQKFASRSPIRRPWQCRSIYTSPESQPFADTEKPYYITTPIFYVNAAPHIGHLYTMVLCDVLKRYQQLQGKSAFLSTGTDEHGMKIQQAAAKEAVTPKELVDNNSQKFLKLAHEGGISQDTFIRTTNQQHKTAVSHFWTQLKNGLPKRLGLYKSTHKGWYSVSDECFYPEDLIEPSLEPQTGKKIMVSSETGSMVEWVEEETWFFPLTKYKEQLLKFYDENPGWIQPESKMKEVRIWVENHLEDLSVTRPAARLSWGIRDPEDPKHTIYVWVDALINYLTVAGYGDKWHLKEENMGIWPADLQVVGKDIIRFHAVYWPALLMALDLPLPKKILCHNHWTMSNRKMSKSVGNVVNPFFAIQRWGTDPLRYFLMRNGSLSKDTSYSNDLIEMVYLKELQANIGNLYYRICRPKSSSKWSTTDAIESYFAGEFKKNEHMVDLSDPRCNYSSLEPHIDGVLAVYKREMDNNNPAGAINEIFCLLRETNRYVSDTEPWNITKKTDVPEFRVVLNWVVFNSIEALRVAGILLQPIMPTKAGRLLDELNVKPERRTIQWAVRGTDDSYGFSPTDLGVMEKVQSWNTIFPPTPAATHSDPEVLDILGGIVENPTKNRLNKMSEWIAMEARLGEIDTAISTPRVLLVPYEPHHVLKYHGWMQDPDIQEATASEPLSLEEEYSNQISWRAASDKLTFIVCLPLSTDAAAPPTLIRGDTLHDSADHMVGDVNFFLHEYDPDEYEYDDDDGEHDDGFDSSDEERDGWLVGEVDIMIAERASRGRGMGKAAVCALLVYIQRHVRGLLAEGDARRGSTSSSIISSASSATATTDADWLDVNLAGRGERALKGLIVRIKEGNEDSRALFQKLGFRQQGEVNYFGEIKMALDLDALLEQEWWASALEEYHEVRYEPPSVGETGAIGP